MSSNWVSYATELDQAPQAPASELVYTPRSRLQGLLFLPGFATAGISWTAGGVSMLTDISFVLLVATCLVLITQELFSFSRRFGLGAITLYGGVLMWFCYDYMTNWFMHDFSGGGIVTFSAETVAKAAFLTQLFVMSASLGLGLPMWSFLERRLASIREPSSRNIYMVLILVSVFVGLMPYIFFASDSVPVAIWKDITGGRATGEGFTVGRTGNVNTSWGGYLAQLLQVGQVGSMLAISYAIIMQPGVIAMTLCVLIWLEQVMLAVGSGTRGNTAFIIMPALFLVFLKYQSQAAGAQKRWSAKAYIASAVIAVAILILLQLQITYRNVGFSEVKIEDVNPGVQGNSMFSEGLTGMQVIPDKKDFFYNQFPGEGAILALPECLYRFLYGPIPRALWAGKPIDPVWSWYNAAVFGRSETENEGSTAATGLVGEWYFRFGMAGVVEGGLLFGWLCLLGERMLLNSQGRLIQLISALGLLVFLFRSFRAFNFISLYPLMIGVGFLMLFNRITSRPPELPVVQY